MSSGELLSIRVSTGPGFYAMGPFCHLLHISAVHGELPSGILSNVNHTDSIRMVVCTATRMAILISHFRINHIASKALVLSVPRTMLAVLSRSARRSCLETKPCLFRPASRIGPALLSRTRAIGVGRLLSKDPSYQWHSHSADILKLLHQPSRSQH